MSLCGRVINSMPYLSKSAYSSGLDIKPAYNAGLEKRNETILVLTLLNTLSYSVTPILDMLLGLGFSPMLVRNAWLRACLNSGVNSVKTDPCRESIIRFDGCNP